MSYANCRINLFNYFSLSLALIWFIISYFKNSLNVSFYSCREEDKNAAKAAKAKEAEKSALPSKDAVFAFLDSATGSQLDEVTEKIGQVRDSRIWQEFP